MRPPVRLPSTRLQPIAAADVADAVVEVSLRDGERGYLSNAVAVLAEAVYAQGRLGEAQHLTMEAEAAATPGDVTGQALWQTTRAKLLARRGQFPAARQLADQAGALVSGTSYPSLLAEPWRPGPRWPGWPGRPGRPKPACARRNLNRTGVHA